MFRTVARRGYDKFLWLRINYLLRDEFLTDQAAPLSSPRTAEPGPGQVNVRDNASGRWQIVDGVATLTASSDTATNIPVLSTPAVFTRSAGLAFKHRTLQNPQGPGPNEYISPSFGWGTVNTGAFSTQLSGAIYVGNNVPLTFTEQNTVGLAGIDALAPNTFYTHAHIMRSAGAFHVIGDRLAFIGIVGSANMFPVVAQSSANRHTPDIDRMAVAQLGGVWLDDYGIATQRLAGARSVNDTFGHEAGAQWVEFILTTLPSAGSITIDFRVQDANNKWQLEVTSAGAFNLNEVVAGTPTTRATIASRLAGDRLMCVMDGNLARLLAWRTGGTGSTQSSLYSSVATFTTQTQGEITSLGTGGAVSDLITWPRVLSGSALDWINRL